MNKTALIVAGGKGERMNASIPKQFIVLNDKPILMHTIEVFHRFDSTLQIILVLPDSQIQLWEDLCNKYAFNIEHLIVAGGSTRFDSVKNGLKVISEEGIVAVHDGVRPLVSIETIERCFHAAESFHAVIPVCDMVESVRKIDGSRSVSVDRNAYKLVQTPQVFDTELLKQAYSQQYSSLFTDDASVVESFGHIIYLVEGNRENIKITTPFDLQIATSVLNMK